MDTALNLEEILPIFENLFALSPMAECQYPQLAKTSEGGLIVPEVECGFEIPRESLPDHHSHKRGSHGKHAAVGEETSAGAGKGGFVRVCRAERQDEGIQGRKYKETGENRDSSPEAKGLRKFLRNRPACRLRLECSPGPLALKSVSYPG